MRSLFNWIDRRTEQRLRQVAHSHGRRSLLARLGVALVGGAVLPMLPFDRSGQFMGAQAAEPGKAPGAKAHDDPMQCEYWRYCAFDGYLCTCCGGTLTQCPPGTDASKVSWVGTCLNPKDGRHYLVSYNDCCGKGPCGECVCNGNERERPGYRMGVHNDINWCMASTSSMYHCTVSVIVGVA